jgi:hypothetical protein
MNKYAVAGICILCVCVLLFNCGVRCYYVGNQSCIEWLSNPLRNLLFILKIHLLLTGFFFFFFIENIHITSQALKYLYQFNVIIKHTRNIFFVFFVFLFFFFHFFPLIVPYSVNLPIRPFWNNKNNYEIFFLCFSALHEINPIYDIGICNCVHIVFYYTFLFIVHLQFLQCCIFVLYLPVHIPVFLWMRGGTYFTTYKIWLWLSLYLSSSETQWVIH